jgi:hypothetical protein
MTAMSAELARVRENIARETAGAVSPRRQLLAVEEIVQRHHDCIAAVETAAGRRDGILSAADGVQLVVSLVEQAALALYWLQLAWLFPRLPAKGRPNLSEAKSRDQRHQVLDDIKTWCGMADTMIDQLGEIAPPSDVIGSSFGKLRFQMRCVEINATRHALFSASERTPIPRATFEAQARELTAARLAPGFAERPAGDRLMFWQTASMVYGELNDDARRRKALSEARVLTAGDPDSRAALLLEAMDDARDDQERIALIAELAQVASSFDAGPLFSRDRIGRVSMFRDRLWATVMATNVESPVAGLLVDEAIVCYRTWSYGVNASAPDDWIRIASAWSGGGRVTWRSADTLEVREFKLDARLVEQFLTDMETRGSTAHSRLQEAAAFLDRELGPLLGDALTGGGDLRLLATGPVSSLPLLMTSVGESPIGASAEIACAHPNPAVEPRIPPATPFELLIVDDCFGTHSASVRSALALAAENGPGSCRVLRFDSSQEGSELLHQELEDVLQSVSSAVIFAHIQTPTLYAGEAVLVTGATSRFRIDALAALNLQPLDELVVIGCGSGKSNPFVGDVTIAHAAAMAGAQQILYTLWSIDPKLGAETVRELASVRTEGIPTPEALARRYQRDRYAASAFSLMRP